MTTVNANAPVSSYALTDGSLNASSLMTMISLLSQLSPATSASSSSPASAGSGAGAGQSAVQQLFAAMLQALTGQPASASSKPAGPTNADIGESARKLGALEEKYGKTPGAQAGLDMLSKAMPNLTTAQFDDAVKSLEQFASSASATNAAPAAGTDTTTAAPGISSYELGLLKTQIDSAVAANASPSASGSAGGSNAADSSGNPLLDALLDAIKQIAKGGVSPDESASLSQLMSLLFATLMPQQGQGAALNQLFGGQGGASGGAGAGQNISIDIGLGGGTGSAGGAVGGSSSVYRGFTPAAQRGDNYDPMMFLKNDLYTSAAASNFDPNSTFNRAYNLFMGALSDNTSPGTDGSKSKLNAASMT